MLQPFFENTAKVWQYVAIWIVFAILQAFSASTLIELPFVIILADALAHALIYGLMAILMWSVIKYGNFNSLPLFQRVINYSALAVLTLVVTLGIGYGFELLMGDEIALQFDNLLPVRALITILIYIIITQYFQSLVVKENDNDQEIEENAELAVSEKTVPETPAETEILERIAVKSGQKIHVIMIPEIVYLQADGDYVQIFTMTGKYLKEQTMKYFDEHLPSNQFVRVHRSCIVNVEAISRIELYEKQNQQLTLKNGHQIKVSQAGYKLLRLQLNL